MTPGLKATGIGVFLLLAVAATAVLALEVTSDVYRYRDYEMSRGRYEEYEVRPGKQRHYLIAPERRKGAVYLGPSASAVRIRTRLADSHMGIAFYVDLACLTCHPGQNRNNMHVYREKLTCRQCHGGEPIASLQHYYSPMNPIRRHAYVCGKCHEGAGMSFAAYLPHAPDPSLTETARTFPVLYYAYWLLAIITAGTFAIFIPHTILWGLREIFQARSKKGKAHGQ